MLLRSLLASFTCALALLFAALAPAQQTIYPDTNQRFVRRGEGAPTVIVLYGLASSMQEWMPMVRRIAAQTQVFIYERRGYGRAPIVGSQRGSQVIVDELAEMLDDLNVEMPYVLVGHSLGAIYAQAFARNHPDKVAGLLLVDPSVEQLDRFMIGADEETQMPPMTLLMNRGARAEYRGRRLAIIERDGADPLPTEIPVTVLSAGQNMNGGYSPLQEQVTNLQALMTADSDGGRHLVVAGAGHNLHRMAPHAVELEVARLVALARAAAPSLPRPPLPKVREAEPED